MDTEWLGDFVGPRPGREDHGVGGPSPLFAGEDVADPDRADSIAATIPFDACDFRVAVAIGSMVAGIDDVLEHQPGIVGEAVVVGDRALEPLLLEKWLDLERPVASICLVAVGSWREMARLTVSSSVRAFPAGTAGIRAI